MKLSRRSFFYALLVSLASFVFGREEGAFYVTRQGGGNILASRLTKVFEHRASAAAIGWQYLHLVPSETSIELLVSRILGSSVDRLDFETATSEQVGLWLTSRQRQDFERGVTIQVQGWIVSQTEARLCALTALLHSRGLSESSISS